MVTDVIYIVTSLYTPANEGNSSECEDDCGLPWRFLGQVPRRRKKQGGIYDAFEADTTPKRF